MSAWVVLGDTVLTLLLAWQPMTLDFPRSTSITGRVLFPWWRQSLRELVNLILHRRGRKDDA